ncbi:PTS system mannose/fructose/sorbose family transporter subunit IID [Klebsiella pneumoniae subsp. pneumoniae]|nr:PTS system mannose/fructose/sorbose family transporter subunit IID [Klebsiella pneumoniae subsp. pneumoniae]
MTTKMISEETLQPQAQEETRITPRAIYRRVFWRSFQMEFSWNYERQMNLAFVYALIPVLKKLLSAQRAGRSAEAASGFFQYHAAYRHPAAGGSPRRWKRKTVSRKNMDATAIDNVKASLMGPLAGLGDSFFWGRCASSPPGSAPAWR